MYLVCTHIGAYTSKNSGNMLQHKIRFNKIHIHLLFSTHMHTRTHAHAHTHTHARARTHTHTHTSSHARTHASTHAFTHARTQTLKVSCAKSQELFELVRLKSRVLSEHRFACFMYCQKFCQRVIQHHFPHVVFRDQVGCTLSNKSDL